MKFINIMPVAAIQIPIITIHLGPNLSENQPTRGEVIPPSSRPIPGAHDVEARPSFSSLAMCLKKIEIP
jgi:hypothetical protein